MVEGARLESVYTSNRIEGSNPFLSAYYLSIKLSSEYSIVVLYFYLVNMIETESFKQLYNEYKNLVYNLTLHYLQNKEESEDIVLTP